MIASGCKSGFQPGAVAHTYVPTTMGEYVVQKTRWNKSFCREAIWTLKDYRKFSLYSLWDVVAQIPLFFLFLFALGAVSSNFLDTLDLRVPLYYLMLPAVMASLRSVYGLLMTRDLSFLLFVLHGFLHNRGADAGEAQGAPDLEGQRLGDALLE